MDRRSSDTLLFPGTSRASAVVEEPVYEVDGVAVGQEETRLARRGSGANGAPRRLRPADERRATAGTYRSTAARGASGTRSRTRSSSPDETAAMRPLRDRTNRSQHRTTRAEESGAPGRATRAERASRRDTTTNKGIGSAVGTKFSAAKDTVTGAVGAAVSKVTGRKAGDESGRSTGAPAWMRPWVIVVAAVLVAGVFLYGPTKDLYWAHRDNEVLTAQAQALDDSNAEALARVQALSTEDGIKDEARLHGYVEEGEEAVTVQGLPGEEDESEAAPVPDDVAQQVLEQEDPWYIQALDTVFGYDKTARN